MKVLMTLARFLAALTLSAVLTAGCVYVASEAVVVWYMQSHGIAVRSELANDMGFGMVVLFWSCVAALAFIPLLPLSWWLVGRIARALAANRLHKSRPPAASA